MHSKSLANSIERQDSYSAGQSRHDFTRQWDPFQDHETTIGEVESQVFLLHNEGDFTHLVYAIPIEEWQHSPESEWLETSSHGGISDKSILHRNFGQEHETSLERSEWKIKHFDVFMPTCDQLPRTLDERIVLSFCHKLVEIVPREGLKELAEAIVEIIDFYQPVREELLALPPVATTTKAVYGESVESPPFFIESDEGE